MSDNHLHRIKAISEAITEWLAWAEDNPAEEFVYISEDLIDDLAAYIEIRVHRDQD